MSETENQNGTGVTAASMERLDDTENYHRPHLTIKAVQQWIRAAHLPRLSEDGEHNLLKRIYDITSIHDRAFESDPAEFPPMEKIRDALNTLYEHIPKLSEYHNPKYPRASESYRNTARFLYTFLDTSKDILQLFRSEPPRKMESSTEKSMDECVHGIWQKYRPDRTLTDTSRAIFLSYFMQWLTGDIREVDSILRGMRRRRTKGR